MLDNLTCDEKRWLYILAAAGAAGAGGYYWKQTKGGLGGAAAGGIVAYLLLAACGPDTTGPVLSPTADGTKTTVVAPAPVKTTVTGSTPLRTMPAKTTAPSAFKALVAKMADAAVPVKQTISGNIGGAGGNCVPPRQWSDSRGSCIYRTDVR